jgi:aspartate racemase
VTTEKFIAFLRSKNVKIWTENGQLHCSAPKGTLTPALRSELAERKREIVSFLERISGAERAEELSLRVVQRDHPLPLSFAQQRLWFLDQLMPGSPAYNLTMAVRIEGSLDVGALERSLAEIVRRHEALRTTFVMTDGQPKQLVLTPPDVRLTVTDLGHLPEHERQEEAHRLAVEVARRPFALARDLLLRAILLRLTEREHLFVCTMHHIASDGWSIGVFNRELAALYSAFRAGGPSPLPDLSIQYADFAVSQRAWLEGEAQDRQLAYWKRQLEGLAPLQLPTDRPRGDALDGSGARQFFSFPPALIEALKALSLREDATLFMTLLAAFQALLHRYTSQADIAVGSPIAGRNHSEVEEIIGFFVNTLVLRTDLSGDPTFRELLGRVREVTLGAYAHQDLPFERLAEVLHSDRGRGLHPLVQIMFQLWTSSERPLELPDLTVTPVNIDPGTAKFDLALTMVESRGALRGSVEYSTALFEGATIRRMARHFETLLDGIIADPERRLSELPLLTEDERHRLLVEWNARRTEYPLDRCVHELFEEQAERTPDAVAVVFEDQQLTYRELDLRANELAHSLQSLGVGPDVPVGVFIERSSEMVVGMLAALKAGGAYVPLDPTYPKERLAFMLEDTCVKVLVTQARLVERLPEHQAAVICLDSEWERVAREDATNPKRGVRAEHLAYVIYTSGSTGEPKGVAIPHRAVNRLVTNTNYVTLGPDDVVAQVSNCSFDAATFEIWGALLNGSRLVILTKDVLLSPSEFAVELERHGVTTLFLTTALFNLMARQMPRAFRKLRHLLFGGEAVDPRWVAEILYQGPPERLLHVYGPTETTTFATWHRVEEVPEQATTIPIGRPIANTECYVLDSERRPVPIGVSGELYIGGDGLARGYLNRPELTEERFVQHPFSAEPGVRLYRTGDLVRYRADGALEFLGRRDHQVKIRGFRVELGEIETTLATCPMVSEVIVVAHKVHNAESRLVAYVVPDPTDPPTAAELRTFLLSKLPEYLVPSAFVLLDRLPLSPNGKVDRGALPAPDPDRSGIHTNFVEPDQTVEHQLTQIWEELLQVRPIGVTDDFFELGGHSLLAVQMMAEIERVCGRKLPLATLFPGATIEYLAKKLVEQELAESRSLLVPVRSAGAKPPFFFLRADFLGGGGFYCLELARALGEDQPFYALALHGHDGGPIPETIEERAASYLQMIRTIQPEGPYLLGGFCSGGVTALEMARQLQQRGEQVALLVLIAASSKNARFTPLHALVSGIGVLFRLGPATRSRLFRLLRDRLIRFEELAHYYGTRLKRLPGLTRGGQISWACHALGNVCLDLVRVLVPGKHRDGPSNASGRRRADDDHSHAIAEGVIAAMAAYFPRPYQGRMTLIWPREEPLKSRDDPTAGWGRVATEIEIHIVPGGHETAVTTHIGALANLLRACVRNAQEPSP